MINLDLLINDVYLSVNTFVKDWPGSSNYTFVLLVFATVLLVIKSHIKYAPNRKMLAQFNGPRPLPIIGNILLYSGKPVDALPMASKLARKYGHRLIVWRFNKPIILLSNAMDAEKLLSSQIKTGDMAHISLGWAVGEGLVTSKESSWKADRKLLNPGFKYQRFDGFLETFNKHGKVLVTNLQREISLGNNTDLFKAFALCTTDSLVESTFGVESNLQLEKDTQLFDNLKKTAEAGCERIYKPWLQLPVISYLFGNHHAEKEIHKVARDFIIKLIEKRRKMLRSGEIEHEKTKPLLDVLMTRKEQNIIDHTITLFFAGYETSSRTLMYTLYLLACNPKHQVNVQEELDTVFDGSPAENVDFAHLKNLKYLERCILESLRIFPTVPVTLRNITSDLKLDETHVIPKGTEVVVDVYNLHHNPALFAEPEKFDPDRFLPEVISRASAGAYAPFSMGQRSCLGKRYAMIQMKVLLSHILTNFDISTTLAREDLRLISTTFLTPSENIPLTLTRRNKNADV